MKRMTRRVVAAIVAGALGSSALTVPLAASATPVTTFAALAAAAPGSPAHSVDRAFTSWAAANLHEVSLTSRTNWADLEPLRRMIGDARVASLGEGLHGSAEPLEFRNRLFQFLVERMDFTAIALESGLTESYALDAYVLGGPGDPRQLAARYITSGLGVFPQQAGLLEWMRAYNLDPRHARKIHFYGMDISGFPGQPGAPLDGALSYLDRVDAEAATALRKRLAPSLPFLTLDRFSDKPQQYPGLPQGERDAVTAAIADLVTLYETRESDYIHATSESEYELACRSALAARQVDDYLRQVPIGWSAKSGPQSILGTVAVSDRAKLENIEWIRRQQQRDGGRLLIFTHLGHAAPTRVTIRLGESETLALPPMVGMYLKRRYGTDLVTLGHFFGRDLSTPGERRLPAAPDSFEGLMASLHKPAFVLDLRPAPAPIREWLSPMHDLYGQRPIHSLRVDEGVDIVLFTENATNAVR